MAADLLGLENKVVIVTGAGRGIGRACALMFARAGSHVVAADIDGSTVEETAIPRERRGASSCGGARRRAAPR